MPKRADVLHDPVGNIHPDDLSVLFHGEIKGITTVGGAQDCTATGEDAPDTLQGQRPAFIQVQQAVKAVFDADDLPAANDGGFHYPANYGVQAGTVAAAGEDTDFLAHSDLLDYVAGSSGSATGRFLPKIKAVQTLISYIR